MSRLLAVALLLPAAALASGPRPSTAIAATLDGDWRIVASEDGGRLLDVEPDGRILTFAGRVVVVQHPGWTISRTFTVDTTKRPALAFLTRPVVDQPVLFDLLVERDAADAQRSRRKRPVEPALHQGALDQ